MNIDIESHRSPGVSALPVDPDHYSGNDLQPFDGEITSYIVASSPRSGSTLFCEALARTGRLGMPLEYFRMRHSVDKGRSWGARSLAEYCQEMVKRRSTPNGVFGMKLHHDQLTFLRARGVLVDPTAWVSIERSDRVAQAVSFARAQQTRAWTSYSSSDAQSEYNFTHIASAARMIRDQTVGWEKYFARLEISPLRFRYEEVANDVQASAKRVMDLLLVADDEPAVVFSPSHERQGDSINGEWIARYREECGQRGVDPENPEQ